MTAMGPSRMVTVYWVIEVDGTRYVGWPASPDDTEALGPGAA